MRKSSSRSKPRLSEKRLDLLPILFHGSFVLVLRESLRQLTHVFHVQFPTLCTVDAAGDVCEFSRFDPDKRMRYRAELELFCDMHRQVFNFRQRRIVLGGWFDNVVPPHANDGQTFLLALSLGVSYVDRQLRLDSGHTHAAPDHPFGKFVHLLKCVRKLRGFGRAEEPPAARRMEIALR